MTGPEHYREAERLVALAEEHWMEPEGGDYEPTDDIEELVTRAEIRESARADAMTWLAMAQVHATLAQAAATAISPAATDDLTEWPAWREVCAAPRPPLGEPRVILAFDQPGPGGGSDA